MFIINVHTDRTRDVESILYAVALSGLSFSCSWEPDQADADAVEALLTQALAPERDDQRVRAQALAPERDDQRVRAQMVACPACKADAYDPCTTKSGAVHSTYVHQARVERARGES